VAIYAEIIEFYDQLKNDEYHRYKSWEHCFSYYQKSQEIKNDYASLQLAFYLASWGMYRGSSYLLWKDYKIHEGLIDLLKKKNVISIKLDLARENDSENIELIINTIKIIKEYYANKIKIVNGREKEVRPSITLASKVLLGINAWIPAFDRFFITGMKINNLGGSINKATLQNIFNYYRTNQKEFDRACKYIKKYSGIDYPPMKLVDMYFWEIGRKEEERIKKDKEERKKNLTTAST
jgi:hypothetical protein